jgi:P pilus assembly chaperone PapD
MANTKKCLSAMALCALLSIVSQVYADSVMVSPLQVDFAPGQPNFADLMVSNTGQTIAYIETQIEKIQDPGTANQHLVPLLNNPLQIGLVASPEKIVLHPGYSQVVRLLSLVHGNSQDEVYQVNITPVTNALEAGDDGSGKAQSGISVTIAYRVLVFVRPENPKPNIIMTRDGVHVTVTNTGNTNAYLELAKQCTSVNNCIDLPFSRRMYSGNVWQFDLPNAAPVQFTANYLKQSYTIQSN